MRMHEGVELLPEGAAERAHALVVGRRQTHRERVRRENAITTDDGSLLVELAPQGGCDLDGLDAAAEGLRERAVDGALETLLEAVK